MEYRKTLELKHNREILENNEALVWGWSGVAGGLRLKRRSELINNFITSHNKSIDRDKMKILELGCGTGLLSEGLFCPEKGKIISVDIYENFVRKALNRKIRQKDKISFLVADAEMLPFLDESFDVIVGISILHHLNLNFALKEINRLLKNGGKFIFSEPNMMNPQIFAQKNINFLKKHFGDSPFETAFYAHRIKKRFAEYNLKTQVHHFDFLHPKTPKPFISVVQKMGLWLENSVCLKHISGSLLIYGIKTGA